MNEFEKLAKHHGLSINKNEHGYLDPKMKLAQIFYDARQTEIDFLKHDLANEKCANVLFEQLHNNLIKKYKGVKV